MYLQGGNSFFHTDCIDFSANNNFLGIPDPVMSAARSGLVAAIQYSYENHGSLSDHVAAWEGVRPEHVFCANGSSDVIRLLVQVLRPRRALLPAPGFEEYTRALTCVKCELDYFYTEREKDFRIPQEEFCERITEETDVVFLCNPSNPTTVLYDRSFVSTVLERCTQMHAMLILDECFLDFVEHADEITMCSADASPQLFIVKAFTKIFAMPGIRLGYGLCTNSQVMEQLREAQKVGVSMVAQRAGIACTKERGFVEETVCETSKERSWLMDKLRELGFDYIRGEANFIFFTSRPGLHAFSIQRGIMLRDCSNFEGLIPGYYRVNVRSREENEKLVDVLRQWQEQEASTVE